MDYYRSTLRSTTTGRPSSTISNIDMSLAAAERARKASEMFIERVDELVPNDPTNCHRESLMEVDSKIALLKKNVVSSLFFVKQR